MRGKTKSKRNKLPGVPEGFHPEDPSLQFLSKNSYKPADFIGGYKLDKDLSNDNHQIYYHPDHKRLIMSVAGTHNSKDYLTDLHLATGNLKSTDRYKSAHSTLRAAKDKYGVSSATVTGHSLGGAIAGYIAGSNDNVLTLNKGATIGQGIRSNERAYRKDGDPISFLNKYTHGMKTMGNSHYSNIGGKLHSIKNMLDAHKSTSIEENIPI